MKARERSARPARGLLAVLAPAFLSACEITRPAGLEQDAVSLSLLLVAGMREAFMLGVHPHRERDDAPPDISASLEGPGWTARFSDTRAGGVCEDHRGIGPATCLRAWLSEPVQPGSKYVLRGTAPPGSFTGEAAVPTAPVVPADTLRFPLPDSGRVVRIPLRYQVDPQTGTVLADLVVTHSGRGSGYWTERLDAGGVDTLEINSRSGEPMSIYLRLQAIGWNYTNFLKHTGGGLVPPPWPTFGIEGEGVYGYFDGVSRHSPIVHILVGEP